MGRFSIVVPVFVALSCYGSMNGGQFALSRYRLIVCWSSSHIYVLTDNKFSIMSTNSINFFCLYSKLAHNVNL